MVDRHDPQYVLIVGNMTAYNLYLISILILLFFVSQACYQCVNFSFFHHLCIFIDSSGMLH